MLRALGGGRGVPLDMARLGGVGVTAHPRPCSFTGRLVLLGYQVSYAPSGGLQSLLTFREVDAQWGQVAVTEYVLPGYAFVHDFAVTEHYIIVYQVRSGGCQVPRRGLLWCDWLGHAATPCCDDAAVLCWDALLLCPAVPLLTHQKRVCAGITTITTPPPPQNPVAVDMPRFLSGKAAAASCITWTSENTRVHVIPRQGTTTPAALQDKAHSPPVLQEASVLSLPPSFVFHHANAYEEGTRLVVDSIAYPRLPEIWPEGELQEGVRGGGWCESPQRMCAE